MKEAFIYCSAEEIPHQAFFLCKPRVLTKANNADVEMKERKNKHFKLLIRKIYIWNDYFPLSIKPVGLQDWILHMAASLYMRLLETKGFALLMYCWFRKWPEVVISAFTEELQKELNAILRVKKLCLFFKLTQNFCWACV